MADLIGLTGLRRNTWPAEKKWPFSICLHLLSWKLRYRSHLTMTVYSHLSLSLSLYAGTRGRAIDAAALCQQHGRAAWSSGLHGNAQHQRRLPNRLHRYKTVIGQVSATIKLCNLVDLRAKKKFSNLPIT